KYLFATPLQINGCPIELREVSNFSASDPDAINLCFTTTQKLHKDFFFPKENSLTIDDFEDHPVVMISDESHHVNTRTKRASKGEIEEDRSWEYTVSNLFVGNRENVLLEFTATADLRDPNIRSKYKDKIVFDYSLAKFRESGYTKDFQNLQSGLDAWGRTLQALVFSQYRRAMFSDGGISVKPVVLLKSQKIQDSKDFYDEFFARSEEHTSELQSRFDVVCRHLFEEKISDLFLSFYQCVATAPLLILADRYVCPSNLSPSSEINK